LSGEGSRHLDRPKGRPCKSTPTNSDATDVQSDDNQNGELILLPTKERLLRKSSQGSQETASSIESEKPSSLHSSTPDFESRKRHDQASARRTRKQTQDSLERGNADSNSSITSPSLPCEASNEEAKACPKQRQILVDDPTSTVTSSDCTTTLLKPQIRRAKSDVTKARLVENMLDHSVEAKTESHSTRTDDQTYTSASPNDGNSLAKPQSRRSKSDGTRQRSKSDGTRERSKSRRNRETTSRRRSKNRRRGSKGSKGSKGSPKESTSSRLGDGQADFSGISRSGSSREKSFSRNARRKPTYRRAKNRAETESTPSPNTGLSSTGVSNVGHFSNHFLTYVIAL